MSAHISSHISWHRQTVIFNVLIKNSLTILDKYLKYSLLLSLHILPHCQAEQRCRLQRHHIWLWGRDPPPRQAPADRLPDPSAAWSGSQSLDRQEITAEMAKGGREKEQEKKERRRMKWYSASNFLSGYWSKKKKSGWSVDEGRGECITEEKRKRVHCGFTGGQKTSPNISQV